MWSKSIEVLDPYEALSNKATCKSCTDKYKEAKKKYAIRLKWWQKLLGFCPWCGRYFKYNVRTERRNTQYCDEKSNWITACKECREEDEAYFADLWEQYYSGCL